MRGGTSKALVFHRRDLPGDEARRRLLARGRADDDPAVIDHRLALDAAEAAPLLELLERAGVPDAAARARQYPHQLSGGLRQRVLIAAALAGRPKLIIADEPTGNLDPLISWEILQLLLRINELGVTVMMATHNAEVVTALRKRVVALEEGRIIRDEVGGAHGDEHRHQRQQRAHHALESDGEEDPDEEDRQVGQQRAVAGQVLEQPDADHGQARRRGRAPRRRRDRARACRRE